MEGGLSKPVKLRGFRTIDEPASFLLLEKSGRLFLVQRRLGSEQLRLVPYEYREFDNGFGKRVARTDKCITIPAGY